MKVYSSHCFSLFSSLFPVLYIVPLVGRCRGFSSMLWEETVLRFTEMCAAGECEYQPNWKRRGRTFMQHHRDQFDFCFQIFRSFELILMLQSQGKTIVELSWVFHLCDYEACRFGSEVQLWEVRSKYCLEIFRFIIHWLTDYHVRAICRGRAP